MLGCPYVFLDFNVNFYKIYILCFQFTTPSILMDHVPEFWSSCLHFFSLLILDSNTFLTVSSIPEKLFFNFDLICWWLPVYFKFDLLNFLNFQHAPGVLFLLVLLTFLSKTWTDKFTSFSFCLYLLWKHRFIIRLFKKL